MQRFLYVKQQAGVRWVQGWHRVVEGGIKESPQLLLAPALLLAAVVLLLARGRALADLWVAARARAGGHYAQRPERAPRLATLYYARLLRTLERRGFRKADSQTPREFAHSLWPANLAERVAEMTRLYEASRFGRAPADTAELARALGEVEACLRAATP